MDIIRYFGDDIFAIWLLTSAIRLSAIPLEFSAVSIQFQVEASSGVGRAGRLIAVREIETPVFMPVGVAG